MMRRSVYRCVMATVWSVALLLVAPSSGWSMQAGQEIAGATVPQDVVAQARQWATSGKRAEAIASLVARLTSRPDDLDARVLLGIIYTWEGRYADARKELRRVLTDRPGYYDAMSALTYTELWDGHQEQAVTLAESTLKVNPKDTSVLLALARAQSSLKRVRQAIDTLDRLLAVDPKNEPARQMRERLLDSQRHWAVGYGYGYDGFSDGRQAWQEQWVALRRKAGFGSFSFTGSQADRYDLRDRQYEIEMYPRIRPGTYMYLDGGWSPDAVLYPEYRAGAHLYQSLGRGFEASIGMRRLGFGDGINIYIGSLSKYVGSWLFTGQGFLTPKGFGTNASYHVALRLYLTDVEYFGLRYHHGAAKEEIQTIKDIQVLNSDGVSGELVLLLGRRVDLTFRGGLDNQQRFNLTSLRQYSASTQLFVRF